MQRVKISSHLSKVHKLGDHRTALSTKFRVAPPSPPPDAAAGDPTTVIIPGLPDDIAISCLFRLPLAALPACRAVCRRWSFLLAASNDAFFTLRRRSLAGNDAYLFVLATNRSPANRRTQWLALDLSTLSWHPVPSMPSGDRFRCATVTAASGALFVCGGLLSDDACSSSLPLVLKFDISTYNWTVLNRMISPRSSFAAGSIDGTVYVAGGIGADDQFELDSAEAFDADVGGGGWREVARMGASLACYDSAVVDGKLLVTEGWWCWRPFLFSPRGQVYDPRSNTWWAMLAGMREGWTGPSFAVDGRLFVVSEHEGMRVKVYDEGSDGWEEVGGLPVPEMIGKPVKVSSVGRRVYAVGQGLRVAVGVVERDEDRGSPAEEESGLAVRWESVVETPAEFDDLAPSSTQILFPWPDEKTLPRDG